MGDTQIHPDETPYHASEWLCGTRGPLSDWTLRPYYGQLNRNNGIACSDESSEGIDQKAILGRAGSEVEDRRM